MPPRNQVKYVPDGTGAAYWGPGELMTFLITGEETHGAYFLSEISVAPGGGAPPHIHHREDESFHLLEGSLTIQVGGDRITALPGDFVYLPRESLTPSRTPAMRLRRPGFWPRQRALRAFLRRCLSLPRIAPCRLRLTTRS